MLPRHHRELILMIMSVWKTLVIMRTMMVAWVKKKSSTIEFWVECLWQVLMGKLRGNNRTRTMSSNRMKVEISSSLLFARPPSPADIFLSFWHILFLSHAVCCLLDDRKKEEGKTSSSASFCVMKGNSHFNFTFCLCWSSTLIHSTCFWTLFAYKTGNE